MLRGLLFAALVVSACSETAAPQIQNEKLDPVGDYSLQSINGQQLPFVLVEISPSYLAYQTWGTMTLNSNSTFIERDSVREVIVDTPESHVFDREVVITGTWEAASDSIITLNPTNSGILFGVARKMNLTLTYLATNDSTFTYLYLKK